MQIPGQYIGSWCGDLWDTGRKKHYRGEVVLSADGAETTYHMARGIQRGRAVVLFESDGFLVLKEVVSSDRTAESWSGTLLLYLDAEGNLKCVWRVRSQFGSEATMSRVASVT